MTAASRLAALGLAAILFAGPASALAGAAGAPAPPAAPAPEQPSPLSPSRREALAALGMKDDPEARRRGVQMLGETGLMEDVPRLAEALRDPDMLVRALAEQALWAVWSRSGDEDVDRLFALGLEQLAERRSEAAVETFTRVIDRRPDFAEGWNKRATTYYLLGEYRKSLADCDEVLRRNPFHFGALSGAGMNHLQLGEPEQALAWFERALAVNPNLHQVEEAIETLRRLLLERRRNST